MPDFSPYIQHLGKVLDNLLAPDILLGAGVLTAVVSFVGRLAIAGAANVLSWLHSRSLRTVKRYEVAIARKELPFDRTLLIPRCLIVRFGTDLYIERMASDRERHDGRLQNRLLDVSIQENADGSTSFRLVIPVHKRLGTQFKCFVDVQDGSQTSAVLEFLSTCQSIVSPERSSSPLHPNRIYFLLKDFATASAVDGPINNLCLPE